MKITFVFLIVFLTSFFLIGCQSQRYNIKEEKNVIIPTDIVTFYFPLHRINQYVVEYTMKYSNGDKPEYLGEYVFHVDAPSYRIDVVKESSLVINFMFDEALYGITRMIDKNEAIVIDNEVFIILCIIAGLLFLNLIVNIRNRIN